MVYFRVYSNLYIYIYSVKKYIDIYIYTDMCIYVLIYIYTAMYIYIYIYSDIY